MMDIFLTHVIIDFPADFQVRSITAFTETMIPFKKNQISQTLLVYIALDYFEKDFIAPGKTGTSQTYYYLSAMIHS
jgi:hypothetical protein